MATGMLRLQLVKSGIGYDKWQKRTLKGLGLYKRHQVVERKDNPAVRGMVYSVRHLVKATIQGLLELRTKEEVARLRGVTL